MATQSFAQTSDFYFKAGALDVPCLSVSGLGKRAEPTSHNVGATQRGKKLTPMSTTVIPSNPKVTIVLPVGDTSIQKWFDTNCSNDGKRKEDKRDAIATVPSPGGKKVRYQFKGCFPIAYETDDLDSEGGFLKCNLELVCEEFTQE